MFVAVGIITLWMDVLALAVLKPVISTGYAMEKKSSIIAIGLTIHNTPVEIREKLAIPEVSVPYLRSHWWLWLRRCVQF